MAQPDVVRPAGMIISPPVEVPDSGRTVPLRPSLGPGVQLIGEAKGSGFQARQWLVLRGEKFIQVTELLYRLLERADGTRTLAEIAADVAAKTGRPVSENNVKYLIDQRLLPLGLIAPSDSDAIGVARPKPAPRSPLKIILRKKVLSPTAINPFTLLLQLFFFPPVLVMALAAIVASQWWTFSVHGLLPAFDEVLARPELLLVLGALSIVSGVFHEFGHASALRYGGGKVRGMGVGLYIVYPAFYTDVTDSYRLGRWGRVRTDLGGVYFNLIFSLAVLGVYAATRQEYLLLFVLFTDLEVIDQFSPFLRFDGYWALADLSGLPDFFSLMGPFLRSLLPRRWRRGPHLPPLKGWVKALFALYCLVTVPLLTVMFTVMAVNAPTVLRLTWRALAGYGAGWMAAYRAGDIGNLALQMARMALVGLPALGLLLTLAYLAQRALRTGLRLFRWSASRLMRCVAALGHAAAKKLSWLWLTCRRILRLWRVAFAMAPLLLLAGSTSVTIAAVGHDVQSAPATARAPQPAQPAAPTTAALPASSSSNTADLFVASRNGALFAFAASDGRLVWSTTAASGAPASAGAALAYSGGTLYSTSLTGDVLALRADTGALLWRAHPGTVIAAPAVADGVVYAGSADGHLYALDARTGALLWWYWVAGHDWFGGPPAVADGAVYAGNYNGALYAFDAHTGAQRWRYQTGGAVAAGPAVADGTVYAGSADGTVYALDATTGTVRWHFATGGAVYSSPAVVAGALYVGSSDGLVYALDAATGAARWRVATGGPILSSPAVAGGTVYVSSLDGTVYALDASTGATRWRYAAQSQVASTPAVTGGTLYIGASDGLVRALDAGSGRLLWAYRTGSQVTARPVVGP